ncbi:MAG: AsmA-like C-terminal domain-containing protein, partial [Sedimentisphaerales bacterium]|nr:AsmA-like C-terminal domain-containing protein [Sedimentisphaerales bacterium]
TDMQVGKLSPLAKLLQVLQLNEPKDYAFDQMLVDSYIKNNKLFIETFDLSGQTVAFKGSGVMDLQTDMVDLLLTARGKRLATDEPSIWQSLTESLGTAVVKMEVSGYLYNPEITTTTLSIIKKDFKLLGIENQQPE